MENVYLSAYNKITYSDLKDLRNKLFKHALKYCIIRNEWIFLTPEEKTSMDDERTICHNAFIDALNILSRNMSKAGEDNEWRNTLGNDRKVLGDFACFIVYRNGVASR